MLLYCIIFMVIKVKNKIKVVLKKIVLPVFVSIMMGGISGSIIYSIYTDNNDVAFSGNTVYLLQTGAYSNYDNMRANSLSNDYIYYEDDGLFKTIIGLTHNLENVEKIRSIYKDDIVVNKYLINNKDLFNQIVEFDDALKKENDTTKISELVVSMLKKYHDISNMQLTKIN